MTPPKKIKGVKTPIKPDPRVIAAEAFDGKIIPTGWQKEQLNAGFAIIHDKILVIDPFADNCVVVIGSHNLGYKASYDNDGNLVIIEGNKKLYSRRLRNSRVERIRSLRVALQSKARG
jgi:phosphatidylserine/phosphatidylglycerophosphate/cardiolipin synthase-like enzyme